MSQSRDRKLVLHSRVVTGSGGGPDRTILNSPRFLIDRGYDSLCVYLRPPNDALFQEIERRATQWSAPLVAIDDRGAFDLSVWRALHQLCLEKRPVIWHGHDYKSNVLGALLKRKFPMYLVTTVHGWVKHTWKTPLFYALDRLSLRFYDRILCVSQGEYDQCTASGLPQERLELLPNSVDLERFHPTRSNKEHNEGPLVIGAVGRLSKEKGFDHLLQAVASLSSAGHSIELHIAGEGAELEKLRTLSRRLGIREQVHFRGFVPDIENFHRELDIFVLSSLREGLPNVVLEAMATGTPVIATDLPGVRPLLQQDKTGLLVEPGSARALELALASMITSPSLRLRAGLEGRRLVHQDYSFATRMDRVSGLYDQLLKQKTTARIR